MAKRNVSNGKKNIVIGKQGHRCANNPDANLEGLHGFQCPLWKIEGNKKGVFDMSGYDIDHIDEFCVSHNDDINNLQALCKMCHSVKTRYFMVTKYNKDNNLLDAIEDEYNNMNKEEMIAKIKGLEEEIIELQAQLDANNNTENVVNNIVINNNNTNNINNINVVKNQCPTCLKIFSRKNKLINHMEKSCKGPNPNKTQCDYCMQNFTRPYHLKRHNNGHCKIQNKIDLNKLIENK